MNDDGGIQYYQTVMQEQERLAYSLNYTQLKLENEKELEMDDNLDVSFDQLVPTDSKYLKKEDVGEDGVILTIKGFTQEMVKGDDGDEQKIVMHFKENYNPMIVNRTNSQLIPLATGAKKTGEAVGKEVVVYNDPTISFGGKVTGGLRIKKVAGEPKRAAATIDGIEDDVPFN